MKFIRMILPALFLAVLLAGCKDDGGDPAPDVADTFVGTWTVSKATLSDGSDVTSAFSGVSINFSKSSATGGSYTAQVSGSVLSILSGNGNWSANSTGTQVTISGNNFSLSGNTLTLTFTDTNDKTNPTYTIEFTKG